VLGAFGWGLLAASSLLVGGAFALRFQVSSRVLGMVMAFGSGVLISAVAYDLVEDAFATAHGQNAVALGLASGALVFFAGDTLIDRAGGAKRKASHGRSTDEAALPIVLGIVLDGVPESIVIGVGLLGGEGVSVSVLAAVFLSNLPEAVAATTGLRQSGWAGSRVLWLWVAVALVSALSSLAGYALFDTDSPWMIAYVLAFAGGAVLTMLADTMMPEAFEHEGKAVGLFTTLGFGLAFALSTIE